MDAHIVPKWKTSSFEGPEQVIDFNVFNFWLHFEVLKRRLSVWEMKKSVPEFQLEYLEFKFEYRDFKG